MTRRDLFLNTLALAVAIVAVVRVWIARSWETHLVELALGFGGLIAFMFPDEFASWLGHRAWRMSDWRFLPENWVRTGGAIVLMACAVSIFVR